MKIYPPTIQGSEEMFEDLKEFHDYTDTELQEIHNTHDCKLSSEDSCDVCEEMFKRGLKTNQ